jgi:hypothetical protein
MQVSISVLAGIVDDVHNVMGDIWKTCLSILNIIDGRSYLYRKELSSILKQDIKIDSKFSMAPLIRHLKGYHYLLLVFREIQFIIEYNLFPISIDL